jgi:hypothetical protein
MNENKYKLDHPIEYRCAAADIMPFTTRNNNPKISTAFHVKSICEDSKDIHKISFSIPLRPSEASSGVNKTEKLHTREQEAEYLCEISKLNRKLDDSNKNQHIIENLLEEYKVSLQKCEEQLQQYKKRTHDLQAKCTTSEEKIKSQQLIIASLEKDKKALSDKWIKLSSRISIEGKHKQKSEKYKQSLELEEEIRRSNVNKIAELQNIVCSLRNKLKNKEDTIKECQLMFDQMTLEKIKLSGENSNLSQIAEKCKMLEAQLQLARDENIQLLEDRINVENNCKENIKDLQENLVEVRGRLHTYTEKTGIHENQHVNIPNTMQPDEDDNKDGNDDIYIVHGIGDDIYRPCGKTVCTRNGNSCHRNNSVGGILDLSGEEPQLPTHRLNSYRPVEYTKTISFPPKYCKLNKNIYMSLNGPVKGEQYPLSSANANNKMSADYGYSTGVQAVVKKNKSEYHFYDNVK